ncbi:hypothetical protein [Ornithinibacillus halotolerans]|uniref:Uncharacterized protein n=1 Tax=Ornithinibacillus halotolerans TaxID=1274357 RepID=A0A916WD47_9BACI|nr:hypothetical protein [Ornithinibacillus halotolerans]GGA89993.1 hypothetical protein GCM10008025_35730 [Ornithinibacillus halotolerans]
MILISILIALFSIVMSLYVFKVVKDKKYLWSSLTFSGMNLLGGWVFVIYNLYIVGLISFIIPCFFFYYHYKESIKSLFVSK